ncbi:MAG: septum formation family protein, partial [Acidimicrobiales bacterium]
GDDSTDVASDADATTTVAPTTSASSAPTTSEATTEAPASTEDPLAGQQVSVFELRAGDCIDGEIGSGQVQRLVRVDCSVPHSFEVFREALIDSSIDEFDLEAISDQAEDLCRTSLEAYVSPDDERDLKFKWFQPTEESWNQEDEPDRVITCLLFDEDGPLTGRAA